MKTVIAIDPGTNESAILVWSGKVELSQFLPNTDIMELARGKLIGAGREVAIEMVACYGMPVGKEVFETCLMIGKLIEAFSSRGLKCSLFYRKDIKLYLCGSARAKDANIRQALIDKLGVVGTKKAPGPLYGISGHLWSALAVADYAINSK